MEIKFVKALNLGILAMAILLSFDMAYAQCSSISFNPPNNLIAGNKSKAIAATDFNSDGYLDIAVANPSAGVILFLSGQGNGTFTAGKTITMPLKPKAIAAADFDKNGIGDLVVLDKKNFTVLLGNGDGTFIRQASVPADGAKSVAAGDFNKDGIIDLAVAKTASNRVAILFGQANGSFVVGSDIVVADEPGAITAGDYNKDGFLDMAVFNIATQKVSILLGQGNGRFNLLLSLPVGKAAAISTGDINFDNKLDLVVANDTGQLAVLVGNGAGNFNSAANMNAGKGLTGVAAGDFNSDGRPDLVFANFKQGNVALMINSCDECPQFSLTPATMPAAVVGVAMSHKFAIAGLAGNFNFAATGLPAGLTLAPNGMLTGAPAFAGTFTFVVTATIGNCNANQTYTLTVNEDCSALSMSPDVLSNAKVEEYYEQQMGINGLTGNFNFAVTAGTLPVGLTLTPAGMLMGTPTQTGTFNFTVSVSGVSNCTMVHNYTLVVEVGCSAISFTMDTAMNAKVGEPVNKTMVVTGGVEPYRFIASGLPAGLEMSTNGVVSGSPLLKGFYEFLVTVRDAANCSRSQKFFINVAAARECPIITVGPSAPMNGIASVAFEQTLVASGGTPPYKFSNGGGWPAGIVVTEDGKMVGTPAVTGVFSGTVFVTDANGCTGSFRAIFNVACPSIAITNTAMNAKAGVMMNEMVVIGGGYGPYTFTLNGVLPPGVNFDTSTGWFSGMPTTVGIYLFSLSAIDSNGCPSGTVTMEIKVTCPTITINVPAYGNFVAGEAMNMNFTATGGNGSYTFTSSGLPAGLAMDAAGNVTGSITVPGNYSFTVNASDSVSCAAAELTVPLTVVCPVININVPAFGSFNTFEAMNMNFTATGGIGSHNFTATGLPTGLAMSSAGNLTGSVAVPGTYSFKVNVSDSVNCTAAEVTVSLTVVCAPLTIGPATMPNGKFGVAYSLQMTVTGGSGNDNFQIIGGALPEFVTLSPSGALSGTPVTAGVFGFTVGITDNISGCQQSRYYEMKVLCPESFNVSNNNFTVGFRQPINHSLNISGGAAPYNVVATTTLPPGVSLSPSGVITGMIDGAGIYSFNISITDANGCTYTSAKVTINIPCPTLSLSISSLPEGKKSKSYSQAISVNGAAGAYVYFDVDGLPPLLGVSRTGDNSIVIEGIPEDKGTFNVRVRFDIGGNACGTYEVNFSLKIK